MPRRLAGAGEAVDAVYGLVFNLGSLACRILFEPIETQSRMQQSLLPTEGAAEALVATSDALGAKVGEAAFHSEQASRRLMNHESAINLPRAGC